MKRIFVVLIGCIMIMNAVYAKEIPQNDFTLKVENDPIENSVFITGNISKGESVSIMITDDNIDDLWDNIEESDKQNIEDGIELARGVKGILFFGEYKETDDGVFEVKTVCDKSGDYKIIVNSKNDGIKTVSKTFVSGDDYISAVEAVNDTIPQVLKEEDRIKFYNALTGYHDTDFSYKTYAEYLGFNDPEYKDIDFKMISDLILSEMAGKKFSTSNYDENLNIYHRACLIALLNEKRIDNAVEMISDIISDKSQLIEDVKKYANTEEKGKYLTSKISKIDDFEKLSDEIAKALILTVRRYPDGSLSLKNVMNRNLDVLGLKAVSSSDSIYNALINDNSIETIEAFMNKYNKLISGDNSGNSNGISDNRGGGSGNGSGGTKTSSTGSVNTIMAPIGNYGTIDKLELKFKDLNSVPWAYSAISNLYEKGIINGEDEIHFSPDKEVTREAFVKMLISAMNIQPNDNGKKFNDVIPGAWYEKYVRTAYENKVVMGISETEFGIGKNISRQDMAVMVFNAMKNKGYSPSDAELGFADSEKMSEYAKKPIAELAKIGIVTGVDSTNYDPNGTATRAQAAVIINRALAYLQ